MSDLEARLKRLESEIGPVKPASAWEGYDEASKAAMARHGLRAATRASTVAESEGRTIGPFDEEHPNECQLAALEAANAMEARLRKEGLLFPPLDDDQLARLREIRDEMEAELGPGTAKREKGYT